MAFLPLIPAALYELYGERPLTRKRLRRAGAELVAAFGMLLQVHLLSLEMTVLATAVFCLMRFRRTFSKAVFFTWLKAAGGWGKHGDGGCAALCYEKEKE